MILLNIPFISVAASLALLCPLIIGSIKAKEISKSPLKIIFIYCIVYSFFEILAWVYALNSWQNHFIENSVKYCEILFLGYYYYLLTRNKAHKKLIVLLICFSLSLILWSNFATVQDFNRLDSFSNTIGNICIISIVLLFFYQLLNSVEINNLFIYAHFWIAVAILVYFSGVIFIYLFAEYITFSKDSSIIQFWVIKEYLMTFHRIFFAVGLWYASSFSVTEQANNN